MSRVLITGSSRGIGKSLATTFSTGGHGLILHGRDEKSLLKIKLELSTSDIDCEIVVGDLLETTTIDNLRNIAEKGGVDILINNAGVYLNKPFLETTMDEFREVFEINFMSVVYLTHSLMPIMASNGSGLIININSLAGKSGSNGESAYCASKHALRGFSSSIQFDATKYGIRVIDVYLGAVQTDMTKGRKDQEKFILPEDVAKSIFNVSKNYKSMRVTELNLNRSIY